MCLMQYFVCTSDGRFNFASEALLGPESQVITPLVDLHLSEREIDAVAAAQ
jgi:hypothetical protein